MHFRSAFMDVADLAPKYAKYACLPRIWLPGQTSSVTQDATKCSPNASPQVWPKPQKCINPQKSHRGGWASAFANVCGC